MKILNSNDLYGVSGGNITWRLNRWIARNNKRDVFRRCTVNVTTHEAS